MDPIMALERWQRPSVPGAEFTDTERRALLHLAVRHQHGEHQIFSDAELARLAFVRWLVQSGRLVA